MAAKKRACKNGRTKAGKCRKTRKHAKAGGKKCRTVKVKHHTRKMCKKGKRWVFAKN